MSFVLTATFCLQLWVAFTTPARAETYVRFSVKSLFIVVTRRKLHELRRLYIQKKGFNFIESSIANGEDSTKQPILLNKLSENTFLRGVHLQLSN